MLKNNEAVKCELPHFFLVIVSAMAYNLVYGNIY